MHGLAQHEIWRHRPEEIRQEMTAIRLGRALRADRKRGSGLARDLRWELARFAGLLGKRFRRSH
jgi:hypothetical protein